MQRITLIASLSAVALCGIMVWTVLNAQQQGQQANKALVEKLDELVNSSKQLATKNANASTDQAPNSWPRFKLRFVYNDAAKTPVVGQEIKCEGNFLGAMPTGMMSGGGNDGTSINVRNENLPQKTDENGWVDYGYVHPAVYELNVTMPWGALLIGRTVRVAPGFTPVTIVCPDGRDYRKMEIKLDVPADLQKEKLSYFTSSTPPSAQSQMPSLKINDIDWYFLDDSGESAGAYVFNSAGIMCNPRHKEISEPYGRTLSSEILFEPLKKDFYLRKEKKKSLWSATVYLGNPQYVNQSQMFNTGILPQNIPSVKLAKASEFMNEKNAIELDLAKDSSKTWTITMPDEFWKTVREELEPAKKEIAEQVKDPSKIPSSFGGGGGGGLF